MTFKQWAHLYVDSGWSIFPLQPRSKEPHHRLLKETGFVDINPVTGETTTTWKPFTKTFAPHELIDEWWTLDPDANIGLACGELSSVTVVDIDRKGELSVDEIARKIGSLTMTAVTGGGGRHLFYKYAKGVKNSNGKVHPQVDIKNDVGYVVLPPSIHDKTGNVYKFDPLLPFSADNLDNIADFPQFIIRADSDHKNTGADWAFIFKGVREKVDGRNSCAAQVVGKAMRAMYSELGQDTQFLPVVWDFLCWWNEKNQPPLSEQELKHTFKSIVKRGL